MTKTTLELKGVAGSPYTRKMLALLRYRRIPYILHWGEAPEAYPEPRVKLLPTVYFSGDDGEREAMVDSTPIIRRLETMYPERSALPRDPGLRFLSDLIEDYADEWLTKPMFHYRWAHEADRVNIAPLLIYWQRPTCSAAEADDLAQMFTTRQVDRLSVVGSNPDTAALIEESYVRFVELLDALILRKGFALGARPSAADFAIFGQLSQLAVVEPTPAALTRKLSARVRAWVDRVEDLSGASANDEDWFSLDEALPILKPLLTEIGRVYLPFLEGNAAALQAGDGQVDCLIDGRRWHQPVFPYQGKCLATLQSRFRELAPESADQLAPILRDCGCGELLAET